jgi:hypothetical protein
LVRITGAGVLDCAIAVAVHDESEARTMKKHAKSDFKVISLRKLL